MRAVWAATFVELVFCYFGVRDEEGEEEGEGRYSSNSILEISMGIEVVISVWFSFEGEGVLTGFLSLSLEALRRVSTSNLLVAGLLSSSSLCFT